MSGSGKGLLGLWLYRNGSEWQVKSEAHHHPKLAELQNMPAQQQNYTEGERISVMFSLKNQVGGLVRALSVFQDLGINVLHIESRKSVTEMSSVSWYSFEIFENDNVCVTDRNQTVSNFNIAEKNNFN